MIFLMGEDKRDGGGCGAGMGDGARTVWPTRRGSKTLKSVRLSIKGRFNRLPKRLASCL